MVERKLGLKHLEPRYFERMAQSLGDKTRILEYLPPISDYSHPPKVLDVGAGGGEFAYKLSELGYDVTALDASNDAVEQISYKYPNIYAIRALANHTDNLLGENLYDAIICSSILHEVFSYGDDVHKAGHYSSIDRALVSFHNALKPGGTLIIRDGVLPDDWRTIGALTVLDADDSVVEEYLKTCPFAHGTINNEASRNLVELRRVAPNNWVGNYRSILEFAYTYTWGLESYPRETQELYAVYTLEQYTTVLTHHGFQVTHTESYLQPGYVHHLVNKIRLNAPDRNHKWFDSNAIWVSQKNTDIN